MHYCKFFVLLQFIQSEGKCAAPPYNVCVTETCHKYWAFPELDAHLIKKTWESQTFYPHFSGKISKQILTVLLIMLKETCEFQNFLTANCCCCCCYKKMGIQIFSKPKLKPGNIQIFKLKYTCLFMGLPLISGIAHTHKSVV